MKTFFSFIFVLLFAASIWATPINVASVNVPNWKSGGATCSMRVYASGDFTDSTGIRYLGGAVGTQNFFQNIVGVVTGTDCLLPSFVLPSTSDAISNSQVRYTAVLYDSKGIQRGVYLSSFSLPTSLGTSVTWAQVTVQNQTTTRPNIPPGYYNAQQTDALIQQQIQNVAIPDATTTIKGRAKLSAAGSDTAASDNDPRLGLRVGTGAYSTLASAITAAGSVKTKISYATDQTIGSLVVPANVLLAPEQGAKIISSSVELQGIGVPDPLSRTPLFAVANPKTSLVNAGEVTIGTGDFYRPPHGFTTGQRVKYVKDDGLAPIGGLTVGGLYYAIRIDDDHFKLATTAALAASGTALTFSSPGAGVHLFTSAGVFWTGAEYPTAVSTSLVDTGDNSVSKRVSALSGALWNKAVTIHAVAGTITNSVYLSDNQSIIFEPGEYLNTFNPANAAYDGYLPPFSLGSNSTFTSVPGAVIYESGVACANRIAANRPLKSNVQIINNHFKGVPGALFCGVDAFAYLDSATNSKISGNWFDGIHSYHAIIGGLTPGDNSIDNEISDNLHTGFTTQIIAVTKGRGIRVLRNRILVDGVVGTAQHSLIDIEPNVASDNISDLVIDDNIISEQHSNQFWRGISVQATGTLGIKNVLVRRNQIFGGDIGASAGDSLLLFGIETNGVDNFEISGNYIQQAQFSHLAMQSSRRGRIFDNHFAGNGAVVGQTSADLDFYGNFIEAGGFNEQSGEFGYAFTSDGTQVAPVRSATDGGSLYKHSEGLQILFNQTLYTINQMLPVSGNADYFREFTTTPLIPVFPIINFNPAAVNVSTDEVTTSANHNYTTGAVVKFNSTGTFGGLAGEDSYYLIPTAANKLRFATTRANALAGTYIDLTIQGTGVHSLTPVFETRFVNSTYKNNRALYYGLAPLGKSKILSKYDDAGIASPVTLAANAAAETPLSLKMFAGQTAKPFRVFDADGTTERFSISPDGSFFGGRQTISNDAAFPDFLYFSNNGWSGGLAGKIAGTYQGLRIQTGTGGTNFEDINGANPAAQFDQNGTAGAANNTRFLLFDLQSGTLKRVSIGAADSGGTGYKVLRVPN